MTNTPPWRTCHHWPDKSNSILKKRTALHCCFCVTLACSANDAAVNGTGARQQRQSNHSGVATQSVVFQHSEGQKKQIKIRNNNRLDFVFQHLQLVLHCDFAERRLKLDPLAAPFIDLTQSELTWHDLAQRRNFNEIKRSGVTLLTRPEWRCRRLRHVSLLPFICEGRTKIWKKGAGGSKKLQLFSAWTVTGFCEPVCLRETDGKWIITTSEHGGMEFLLPLVHVFHFFANPPSPTTTSELPHMSGLRTNLNTWFFVGLFEDVSIQTRLP